jgi:hypothetical protein
MISTKHRTIGPGHLVLCSDGEWRELTDSLKGTHVATNKPPYKFYPPREEKDETLTFEPLQITKCRVSPDNWFEVIEYPYEYMRELYSNRTSIISYDWQKPNSIMTNDSDLFLFDAACCEENKYWHTLSDLIKQRETDVVPFPDDDGDIVWRHRTHDCHWLDLTFLTKESWDETSHIIPIKARNSVGEVGYKIIGEPILVKYQSQGPIWI